MAYSLGAKSQAELTGVHPQLVSVVQRAIQLTTQDFAVHDGLRTEAEQRELVARGASQTMNSMHRKQPDGFGHAFDLVPYINGKLRWEWGPIYHIAAAVRQAADEQNVALVWGAVWDKPFLSLGTTAAQLEDAVEGYVARRRAMGKRAFIDGPHYQLA
jgi:peptidoglycan L-alanyl-D-glutamate endopeptidase CwlK